MVAVGFKSHDSAHAATPVTPKEMPGPQNFLQERSSTPISPLHYSPPLQLDALSYDASVRSCPVYDQTNTLIRRRKHRYYGRSEPKRPAD